MGKNPSLVRLQQRMNQIPQTVRKAIQPALKQSGDELVSGMKALTPVDTGALRDSIVATPGGSLTPPYSQPGGRQEVPENAVVVTVGNTDVRYPHLVEYGTKDAHAQPFFWPVIRSKKKKIANRVKRAISKAAREEWKK